MKTLLLTLSASLFLICAKAQTRYAFVFAYSSSDKMLYISSPVNINDYTGCTDDYGYNSKISPEKCILRAFQKSVKIEAGSSYNNYLTVVKSCRYENYQYNCNSPFSTESETASAIRDVIAEYRSRGYSMVRVNPEP